ncbi:MAG: undecaprenyldiphospho-muramoylpentapeptide beta-N-acetylglucosaminyltransferase [Erysipelotrichaceae bacterium]|nr:undecaprenyldiphospho-muramoylpentapeptide beta-N-acetylglucosaminyltransferase [Erysipelotrichaceae bacterium]
MRVVISAGGTGGHIYPAVAIINKIKKEEPNSEFLYIGTHNRMEKDLIPSMNIPYEAIEVTGFARKFTLENFKTLTRFLKARKKCLQLIKDFNPDIVIGAGGYVTAPVIWAAKKLGHKTFIHEQNSVVGLSNKYLTKYVDKIGVSFESTLSEFPKEKVSLTGNPCSEKAIMTPKRKKSDFGLSDDKKLVLIVMGSLGSKSINEKMVEYVYGFRNKNYEVIFVTGNNYYEKLKNRRFPDNVKVVPFIENLPSIMKSTDLMVSRAGASTMSEIMALGIPTIFIPSPYVTNNHQYKNAKDLVDKNAALMIEEKDLTKIGFIKMVDDILEDEKKYNEIKKNVSNLGIKDSSTRIYNILKEMILNDKKFY